jgi:phage terminase large subunit-like protein
MPLRLQYGKRRTLMALSAGRIRTVKTIRKETHKNVWQPYPKQVEFFTLGADHDERMLRAGNQLGKSDAGAYETSCHLTGLYPSWWTGRRFNKPIRAWCAGESAAAVRDIMQSKLCGRAGVISDWGSGFIPKECLLDRSLGHGASDSVDTLQVRHVSGGISTLKFMSYEQGRSKFQGEPVDWIWLDEEPDADIYSECRTRLVATRGASIVTYTPLKGRTALVSRFDREEAPGRALIRMSVFDVEHLGSDEDVARLIASYPVHEREARAYGEPVQGSGRVFSWPEELVRFDPETLPPQLLIQQPKLWGIDFGISHPFAAVLICWDKDADIIYVLDGFKVADQTKLQHVPRMRAICASAPVAWPHDGHSRDKGSGEELAEQYKNPFPGMPGLNMLPDHAQFEEGGYSTEAGIAEMVARLETGRLRVNYQLAEWWDEYRDLHREKGLLVKVNDDLLSATRIAIMQRRSAKQARMGDRDTRQRGRFVDVSRQPDEWDIWSGKPIDTSGRPPNLIYRGPQPGGQFDPSHR